MLSLMRGTVWVSVVALLSMSGCSDDSGGASGGTATDAGSDASGASGSGGQGGAAGSGGVAGSAGSGGNGGDGGSAGAAAAGGAGGSAGGSGSSLRFFGTGQNDVDRVKIRIDDENDASAGPPVDVGAGDFTIEFWISSTAAQNGAGSIACGGYDWINGNIVFDRDRYNQGRAFGISIAGGRVAFGVNNAAGESTTICATSDVLDASWHHVAVQRRRSDGRLWIFVDGSEEASADGPDGDVSYPDDGVPGNHCGGPCDFSDPFIVLGAEKHDAGPSYPSYDGLFDELRISNVLRYSASFAPPDSAFAPDSSTVGLYHFDEGAGTSALDSSGAAGGPSHGTLHVGGNPAGPEWSGASPF